MSNSLTFPSENISPRSYAKLPAIKQKDNGNIISSDQNEIMQSAYREDYTVKGNPEKLLPFKPLNQIEISKENFNGKSNYDEEFVSKKVAKLKSLKPLVQYSTPADKMIFNTNYSADYNVKKSERNCLMKPSDSLILSTENGENCLSNYNLDFNKKDIQKSPNFRPNYTYKPTEQEEISLSNYQTEFQKRCPSPIQNFKPKNSYELPTEPFQTNTSYSSEFIGSKSLGPTKSFKSETNFRPPEIPFHTLSSYQEGFQMKKEKPIKLPSFKPKSEYKSPEESIDTATTYISDFQKGKNLNEKTKSFKPILNYNAPTEPIDSQSSYQVEFQGNKNSPRTHSIKPINQIEIVNGKFESISEHNSQFYTSPYKLIGPKAKPFLPENNSNDGKYLYNDLKSVNQNKKGVKSDQEMFANINEVNSKQ